MGLEMAQGASSVHRHTVVRSSMRAYLTCRRIVRAHQSALFELWSDLDWVPKSICVSPSRLLFGLLWF